MTENISLVMAFGAGLLSFVSPCVLPLIPSYLCVIGGAPVAAGNAELKPRLVLRTFAFVLGFSAVFITLSVLFTAAFGMMGGVTRWVNIISGAVVIVLGFNMIFHFLKFLNYEKRFHMSARPGSFAGALLAGGAFGAGWTPCIGPVLAGILLLAAQSGGIPRAVLYLTFFSAGMGLPFLLASVFFNVFVKMSAGLRARLPLIQKISGVLLVAIGIAMLSGHYRALNALAAKWQSSLSAGGQSEKPAVLTQAGASAETQVSDNVVPQAVIAALQKAGLPVAASGIEPPDFTVPLLDETAISLSALKGKVIFLNFWATWCGPCRAEMPSMEAVYRQLKNSGLEIIAVNLQEDVESVAAFIKENNFSFPVALDTSGDISVQYGIQAIPTTYIIDKRGLAISRLAGSIDWNRPDIIAALESLLK